MFGIDEQPDFWRRCRAHAIYTETTVTWNLRAADLLGDGQAFLAMGRFATA